MIKSDKAKNELPPQGTEAALYKWPPLLFLILLLQSLKEFVTETIRSRKWVLKYHITKTREGKEVHIEIRYNYQCGNEGD